MGYIWYYLYVERQRLYRKEENTVSTIHIHQMSKADVMMEISLHHRGLLSEVVEYLKATQPLKAGSAATYEDIAKEILYAECVKQFRYSDYITSASDAMSRVNRTYGDWVREENKKRQAQAEREAREFERFKQKCAKKGLDLTRENAKRIKRKALVPMLKILIPCL